MNLHTTIVEEFSNLALQHDLHIENIIPSGLIERFKDKVRGDHNENGYYVLHIAPDYRYAWGSFGHWSLKSGEVRQSFYWYGKDSNVTDIEKRKITNLIRSSQRDIKEKITSDKREALTQITEIWKNSRRLEVDVTHSYLLKKQIPAIGIKYMIDELGRNKLVIPIYTSYKKRELRSLQYIFEDGSKRFCKNTSPKDGFFVIGESVTNSSVIYLCEGYATGVSIYQATGSKVIVAFSAENLLSIAKLIRREINPKRLVICADNDAHREINIGLEKAKDAAVVSKGEIIYPIFKDNSTLPTDFNDLMVLEGLEAVKANILKFTRLHSDTWSVFKDRVFQESYQIIDPWLENNTLNMIYSQPGVGKSWLCLHIAFALASGRHLPQIEWTIKKKCKVVYLDSELKGSKLQQYIKLVGGDDWTHEAEENFIIMNYEDLSTEADFFNPEWRNLFESEVINLRNPNVVIIDNVLKLFGGDLNKRCDWSSVNAWFDLWMKKGITFILVHHTGKYTGEYMGTQGIMASMATSLILSRQEHAAEDEVYTSASFLLECTKDRYAEKKIQSYNVTIRTDRDKMISVLEAQQASKKLKEKIVDMFNEEPTSYNDLAKRINEGRSKKVDASYICKCIKKAYEDGLITRDIVAWESFKIPKPKNDK